MKMQDKIFYNYARFIYEHTDYFKDRNSTIRLLLDGEKYPAFRETLLEAVAEDQRSYIRQILDREREILLEDSANISHSDSAAGYAITYFPILTDIYSTDILYKAITPHVTKVPIMTFPKMQLSAKIKNSDGSELNYPFPRARYLIRSKPEKMSLIPAKNHNLYQLSASYPNMVNDKLHAVNKRYFIIEEAIISVNDSTSLVHIPLGLRPDMRGQLNKELEFFDGDYLVNASIIGNINWDLGKIYYNVIFTGGDSTHTYKCENLVSSVIFSPKTGEIGRVKISLKMNGWDIHADVHEDFEFELDTETIQDYSDIYNIDLIKTFSEAIKSQTLLNRDHDIVKLLQGAEPEMKKFNTYENINMLDYKDSGNIMSPAFLASIYQAIVPRMSIISRYINLNFRVVPQYILAGIRAACLLENLQEYAVSLPTYREGLAGFDNLHAMNIHVNVFLKNIILTSPALDDDKIYMIYKPEDDSEQTDDDSQNPHLSKLKYEDRLRTTVLTDIVYKPLYIIEEVTNSMKRTFVRSRTTLELFRTEGLGCINITGFKGLLTDKETVDRWVP